MKCTLSILLILTISTARAASADSLLPVVSRRILTTETEFAHAELKDVEKYYAKSGNNRSALSRLPDLARHRTPVWNKKLKARLFNDLAGVTVRLKLYSIAMRCYGVETEDADSSIYQQPDKLDTTAIKDDSHHDWDEVAGKFITAKKFNRIITVLQSYEQKAYHLGHNNCTDFGLALAGIGGITIRETRGHCQYRYRE